jgi:hypothetical protein
MMDPTRNLEAITYQEGRAPVPTEGRALMRYRNSFTGEVVETKGKNNKKLREWSAAHGPKLVDS